MAETPDPATRGIREPSYFDALIPLVVLRRRTSRFNDFRGGLEILASSRTTVTTAYAAQWAEFEAHVQSLAAQNLNVVLLIDEAQTIPKKVLIRLRELLNFEADSIKFIQLVLLGTLELKSALQDPALRPLRSRIAGGIATLAPLDLADLSSAIKFRVTVAGRTKPLFHEDCFPLIHDASEGVLRDAVDICRNAILLGYEDREPVISPTTVSLAIAGFDKK